MSTTPAPIANLSEHEAWEPEFPEVQWPTIDEWNQLLVAHFDQNVMGLTNEQMTQLSQLIRNAHGDAVNRMKRVVDNHVVAIKDQFNPELSGAYNNTFVLQSQINDLKLMTQMQTAVMESMKEQIQHYRDQFNALSVDNATGGGGGKAGFKIPEPPTFSGSDSKVNLKDWVNQLSLYNSHYGIITDKHQIVTALTRVRGAAATYLQKYFDKLTAGEDLGTFQEFVNELAIYGEKDDIESYKKALTALWKNETLAHKDFIKYAEQYRTLARVVGYEDDNLFIDKLREVIPKDLRSVMVPYEVNNQIPKKWDAYLELLIKTYKFLHPEKSTRDVFATGGSSNTGNGNNKKSDPDAMDIDSAKKVKAKHANSQDAKQKLCQICSGKGFKAKSKTHNTNDCYEKPGNEHKRPAPRASTSNPSTSGQGNKSGNSGKGTASGKTFYQRLMEMAKEYDIDTSDAPSEVNINSASIQEIVETESSEMGTTAQVDGVQAGPSQPTGKGKKAIRRSNVDFPEGL
ncbi:hypothetical protein PM082_024979 [Marasmius tenuissimus]|nr:hypothetical protein PM082_020085 [Marasmius tenuissimus]KAJ8078196.1 hypothetical protein PM082_000402 [Marasmius tenuissimus]KAJ8083518.1 hypothetical protein PM082_009392 [Marasmius tenuissimus]KAJ8087869.1 hypothetical protein PM082_006725 [Marasmius tenuissimus]KAJ8090798.1 hypothetical protein PM082_024979 [Marasmius tenuissimus]